MKRLIITLAMLPGAAIADGIRPAEMLVAMRCTEFNEVMDTKRLKASDEELGSYWFSGISQGFVWGFIHAKDRNADIRSTGTRIAAICLSHPKNGLVDVLEVVSTDEDNLPALALRDENELLRSILGLVAKCNAKGDSATREQCHDLIGDKVLQYAGDGSQ